MQAAFELVATTLQELSPIATCFRLPEPTWHGHSQAFFQLHDMSPDHVLDFVVIRRSTAPGDRFLERERHGEALMLFDQPVITRAMRRNFPAEAAAFYASQAYRPLIELLRMRHSPLRFDFGPRYLDRDLPAEVRTWVEDHALPADLEQLAEFRAQLAASFRAEVAALDAGEWTLALPAE